MMISLESDLLTYWPILYAFQFVLKTIDDLITSLITSIL